MLSEIRFNDALKVGEIKQRYSSNTTSVKGIAYVDRADVSKRINNYFKEDQIKLIEIAFEGGCGCFPTVTDIQIKAAQFGNGFSSPQERLIAIMNNIIENKGTFKP